LVAVGFDLLLAVGWAAILGTYADISSGFDWAVVAGTTLLAGAISGRYRVLLISAIVLWPVALLVGPGGSCDTGCEDDLSPAFEVIAFIIFVGAFLSVMALGVFLRKEWDRRTAQVV
jgi:hypothetical protein